MREEPDVQYSASTTYGQSEASEMKGEVPIPGDMALGNTASRLIGTPGNLEEH